MDGNCDKSSEVRWFLKQSNRSIEVQLVKFKSSIWLFETFKVFSLSQPERFTCESLFLDKSTLCNAFILDKSKLPERE
jgi:hypothetical protein